jgi:hypothetical protein
VSPPASHGAAPRPARLPSGPAAARDRNKTLTRLAGAEPVVGARHGAVRGLQFFLLESPWDHEQVNQRRVELLVAA